MATIRIEDLTDAADVEGFALSTTTFSTSFTLYSSPTTSYSLYSVPLPGGRTTDFGGLLGVRG